MVTLILSQNLISLSISHKNENADISESKLLEEEIDSWLLLVISIWGVVSLGEDGLDLVLQVLSGLLVGKFVLGNDGLELIATLGELSGDEESGWEDMVVVHDFDKWLEGRFSGNLLLGHLLGNLSWGSLDSSNKGVWECFTLLSIIEWLNNDGLLSSSSSGEENDNSACFHSKE